MEPDEDFRMVRRRGVDFLGLESCCGTSGIKFGDILEIDGTEGAEFFLEESKFNNSRSDELETVGMDVDGIGEKSKS